MNCILETKRLQFFVPQWSDFENLLALRTDPDVMRYIGVGSLENGVGDIQTKEQVKEHIQLAEGYFNEYGFAFFCVFEKKTGEFLGQAGLFHLGYDLEQPDIELAYRFFKKHWGKGYATEAAYGLIKWAFQEKGLPKLVAPVHPNNKQSVRVLEKAGMHYIGDIDYRGHHVPFYEIFNPNGKFPLELVKEIYVGLDQVGVKIWLDGGWGVDAVIGKQTRLHDDLDIVVQKCDLAILHNFLANGGYEHIQRDDTREWNFVMGDMNSHMIDIHVIEIDSDGNGVYGPVENNEIYPFESLKGSGIIGGLKVRCLSPEYQVTSHTGYLIKDSDIHDVLLLCNKFKIKIPHEYKAND